MKKIFGLVCVACLLSGATLAQSPVTVTVSMQSPVPAIPPDFIGLSFGPSALQMHAFYPTNVQMLTLFQNLGIKYFRMGGTWVDTNSSGYMPSTSDIDAFFGFIKAAGLKDVIYSLKLENGDPAQDASTASYIWTNYGQNLACFAIGNEPNLYNGGDPAITNISSYLSKWNSFAAAITNSVPAAKFGGPDSGTGGTSWASNFANTEKGSGIVTWIFSHYYVGGSSAGMTATQMVDGMLSPAWDTATYPAYYNAVGAVALSDGYPYRLTEANSYTGGSVSGGSDGFASALFGLDFMYWWAGQGCSGVSVHTGLSNLNGAVYQDAAGNWQVFPWAYAIKAFDLDSHGSLQPVTITNTNGLNLTAYAVSDTTNLYVTIINKEHGAGGRDATVAITLNGISSGNVAAMYLIAPNGDTEATNGITLGGAYITNNASWMGQWTTLNPLTNGQCTVTVAVASAAVVKIATVGAPQITIDLPMEVRVISGNSYTYAIGAAGPTPYYYQWYNAGTAVGGQTNATYTVTAGSAGSGSTYSVVITNIYGAVTSTVSTLTSINISQSACYNAITNLNPVGYWPMHEVEGAAHGDIETNYGSIGVLGTGYYADWIGLQGITHSNAGALLNDPDTAVTFGYTGAANTGDVTNSLVIPHNSPLSTLNPPFTVECWANMHGQGGDLWAQDGSAGLNNGPNLAGIRCYAHSGTFALYCYDGTNGATIYSGGTTSGYTQGQWYHVVVVDDGTNINEYLNGIGGAATNLNANYSPDYWSPLSIGSGRGYGRSVNCTVDEFAVYTNALSPTDIMQHYNDGINESQAGVYVADVTNDHPVIYLRMDSPPYTSPSLLPEMINYGSARNVGVYSPGAFPGAIQGLPYVGLSGTNVPALSGVSSFADAGFNAAYNPVGPQPFTVSAIFHGNPTDVRDQTIVGHTDSSWRLWMSASGNLQWQMAGVTLSSGGVYNDGNWHQVVAVYQPASNPNVTGTNLLYVDGALDTKATGANTNGVTSGGSTADVLIGADPEYTNNPADVGEETLGQQFAGQICEVALFTNALTAAQAQTLYAAINPVTVNTNPTNLVFSVSGNQLTLSWPADHTGWRLQAQTNALDVGISTHWFDVANSTSTNQIILPINPTNPSVFYRLLYP